LRKVLRMAIKCSHVHVWILFNILWETWIQKYFPHQLHLTKKVVNVGYTYYCKEVMCKVLWLTISSRVPEKLIVSQTNQEILHPVWNLKVYYCVHKTPPLDLNLCYMKTFHTLTPIYLQFILTLSFHNICLPKWSLVFQFPIKILCAFLIPPTHATISSRTVQLP
jgi:hypothetical protein